MSWRKVKLGELVENFSVRAKDVGGADGLDFFGVSNEVGITKTKYAAEDKAEDYKIIEQYCFAYNPYRVNVGSIGMVTEDIKGLISPAYVVFKPKPNSIKAELLLKFLKSSEGLRQIRFYARGTVRQALRFEDLCNIELSLPDFEEQEILFEKLNEVENEANELETELTYQQDLLKQLRQSFLNESMRGKLVEHNPKDGNANDQLEKIKSEKLKLIKKKKLKAGKSTEQSVSFTDEYVIPTNWAWCKSDDIFFVTKLAGFEYSEHIVKLKEEGEIPVVRAQNVRPLEITKKNLLYIDKKTSLLLDRCSLTKKCLLVTFIGAGIGDVATFDEKERWHLAPNVAKMEPFEGCEELINIKFINYFLMSDIGQREIFKHVKATAQPCLSMGTIRDMDIPFPPLAEQKRIVKKLEEVMNLCEELKTTITDNQNYTDMLLLVALKDALQPKEQTKIISLPVKQEVEKNYFIKRKVLATYIINQSLHDTKFGDTKFEKELHLAEYFAIKRNLNQNYLQKAAGPYDNKFTYAYFQQIEKSKWFIREKKGSQFIFKAGQNHDKSANTYNYFSKEELMKVNEIISYFKNYDYEQPEIISTFYAVWNNRIIQHQEITNSLLIEDFYKWDKQKKKYKQDRLEKALQWMIDKKFVPDGWGKLIVKAK